MTIELTPFQDETVNKITRTVLGSLNTTEDTPTIILKSPTGSGKTFMLSSAIKQISNSKEGEVVFIWIAPQKLHQQSKDKLEKYLINDKYLQCTFFRELSSSDGILDNQILFLNWESINKGESNVIIKENESNFYLTEMIEKTKKLKRKIILIIDESHRSAKTSDALSLIEIISPDVTIEASATPSISTNDVENYQQISIPISKVKKDNLIVDKIIIQDGIEEPDGLDKNNINIKGDQYTNEEILKLGLKKRKALEKDFIEEGTYTKPLLLIQLPDRGSRTVNVDELMDTIVALLKSTKITTKNKKLAIYLSDEKINLDKENQPLDMVEVLIFKQAIAVGWDCPRSQILVIFRDMKSYTFEIQTIGRITRFPHPQRGYFSNPSLNNAYIYTNLNSIGVKDEFSKSFLSYKSVFRDKKLYDNLNLPSWYTKRQREKTRLRSEFKEFAKSVFKEQGLKDKLIVNNNKVERNFFDETVKDEVSDFKNQIEGERKIEIDDHETLQSELDLFSANLLKSEYFPEKRSIKRVVDAFYDFFKDDFNLDYKNRENHKQILKIILDSRNQKPLQETIQRAIEVHKDFVNTNLSISLSFVDKWNIPNSMLYSGETSSYSKSTSQKSILKSKDKEFIIPNKLWSSEEAFIKKLESSKKVKWWFKNGDGDGTSFAVKCINKNNDPFPFFVDFIVFFNDDTVGLYDTKSGFTQQMQDISFKHDGLQKAINNKNYKLYKLTGGIVANTDGKSYSGVWRVYKSKNSKNISDITKPGWEELDF